MTEWQRNTPWRQGHLLESAVATELGLNDPDEPDSTLVIVISQDCDIAQNPSVEPQIEIVIGRRIGDDVDKGNNTNAKNARKLCLSFEHEQGVIWGEFIATKKKAICKLELNRYKPRADVQLTFENLTILQTWLASRYRRSAFSDEFETRLKGVGLDKKLSKIVKPYGELILGVLFDVDEGKEIVHEGPDDPYTLDIMILHRADPDFEQAESAAIESAKLITKAFKDKFYKNSQWQGIELRFCEPTSESVATYQTVRQYKKWNLDSLSLAADPQQLILD
ncbi:hypothetical protein SS15_15015 [Enterobacter roggenkampii]|uniref:hypothetical protein n=1 Tax=Enterobacter roggenkampii TaxID=1812935 RepID=UPI0005F04B0A|nr:hypothetical protein [Enterobacter roggenkampii]KJM11403.1 hypothetical protein SS15_15015 [Enterobacter roggenkampii]MCC1990103.1 hypothetical protein [Enterobacter roggenkampii]